MFCEEESKMAEELNTRVRMMVRSSNLQSVPVDDTLSIEGQAADAAAVGAALANKADISQIVGIQVNGQEADQQGKILVDGSHINVSGSDTTKISEKIAALDGKTAADIPMSSATGASSVADAINNGVARNADAIPMEAGSEDTVKDAIDDLNTAVGGLEDDVEAIEAWTAANLPYVASGDSVKKKIDDANTEITAIKAWDSDDILYETGGEDSIKDKLDDLYDGRVKTVNGEAANASGNVTLEKVPFADDLFTEDNRSVDAPFIIRTAGGSASITTGTARVQKLKGNSVHTGFVAEALSFDVINEPREDPNDNITAELDRDDFVAYVEDSATITLSYSSGDWKVSGETVDPTDYGLTITGTPIAGDTIVIHYTKEERGEITPAEPEGLTATGWNLFNYNLGYARVTKYDGKYKVGGSYSTIRFALDPADETTSPIVVDSNGLFEIEEDGYVILTGTAAASTYILCCWSDWEGGYEGSFQQYAESSIDLTAVMASLPYGLCSVGNVYDEINFATKQIIQRVGRSAYSAEARAAAEASGRAYDFDEDYVYLEMTAQEIAAATSSFELANTYSANEHGIEFFTGTNVAVGSEISYGTSLKDKLRRDVLTMSQQTLTSGQKTQVLNNIGAASAATVTANKAAADTMFSKMFKKMTYNYTYSPAAGASTNISAANFGISAISGYTPVAILSFYGGHPDLVVYYAMAGTSGTILSTKNVSTSQRNDKKASITILFVKNGLL